MNRRKLLHWLIASPLTVPMIVSGMGVTSILRKWQIDAYIEALNSIMNDEDADPELRLRAAIEILDRAYGKAER